MMRSRFCNVMKSIKVHYEGRVQGVGFRWTVKNLARGFDVVGTVKNLADGRVELVAQGDSDEVSDVLDAIRRSDLAGHIALESPEAIPRPPGLRNFQIIE